MRLKSLILLAATTTSAFAGAEVAVRSATQARVFFDDQEIGQAPIRIRDVDPGFHEVRVESVASGESRVYEFYSPRNTTVTKNIDANFGRAAYDDVSYQGQGAPDDYNYDVAGQTDQVPPEAYEEAADRSYEEGKVDQKERTKVRIRNTAIGAGLLNELLNKGSSKKTIRNTALGGILLNEIINR